MLKHQIEITFLLFFLSFSLMAQKKRIRDQFIYKAVYEVTAQLDSLDKEFIVKEENHLLIGNGISSFSSKALLVDRSIKSSKNIASTPKAALTEFPFIIVKNIQEDNLYYLQKVGNNNLMYQEKSTQFDWQIKEDYKLIGKYNCQKAIVDWSGRRFIAWFTLDLPLAEGPYKFSGLPGLIVQIEDSKGYYRYQLTSFSKLVEPLEFVLNLNDYIKVSKAKLKKEFRSYSLNPNAYLNDPNVTMSPRVLNAYKKAFAERVNKRNNPIELDK